MHRIALLVPLLVAAPLAAQAAPHPLVGRWRVSYAGGLNVQDGRSQDAAATFTVREAGDSLIAEVQRLRPAGVTDATLPAPVRLTARKSNGSVSFVGTTRTTLVRAGETREATQTLTWRVEARQDTLVGTITSMVDGMVATNQNGNPVTGTRDVPTLAGTWRLGYILGRNASGEEIRGTGTLTLAAKGDSLVGELVNHRAANAPAGAPATKPAPVAFRNGRKVSFSTSVEATARSAGGEAIAATVISLWSLELKGDSLLGTVTRSIEVGEGRMTQEPLPVTGTRATG